MRWTTEDEYTHIVESIEIGELSIMAKKKQYEVTFDPNDKSKKVTYPIEATSKQEAALEFSRQYIGRRSSALASLVKVTQVQSDEEEK